MLLRHSSGASCRAHEFPCRILIENLKNTWFERGARRDRKRTEEHRYALDNDIGYFTNPRSRASQIIAIQRTSRIPALYCIERASQSKYGRESLTYIYIRTPVLLRLEYRGCRPKNAFGIESKSRSRVSSSVLQLRAWHAYELDARIHRLPPCTAICQRRKSSRHRQEPLCALNDVALLWARLDRNASVFASENRVQQRHRKTGIRSGS